MTIRSMADLIDRAGIELTLAGDPHELLTQLQAAGVRFNDSARTLLFRPALARDLQTSRPVRVVADQNEPVMMVGILNQDVHAQPRPRRGPRPRP